LDERQRLELKFEEEMAVSAVRGSRLPIIPVFHRRHHLHCPQILFSEKDNSSKRRQPNGRGSKRFTLSARYSQAQDLFSSTRLQGTFLFLSMGMILSRPAC
jgi:hypothetical protein